MFWFLETLVELITAKNMRTEVKDAVDIIYHHRTLPPQIDYVSPGDKAKVYDAEELLANLPSDERGEAYDALATKVDSYYAEDERGFSTADYDAMF